MLNFVLIIANNILELNPNKLVPSRGILVQRQSNFIYKSNRSQS